MNYKLAIIIEIVLAFIAFGLGIFVLDSNTNYTYKVILASMCFLGFLLILNFARLIYNMSKS